MKASNLALTAIGGMNYLLLRVADKNADMSSEVRHELERFVRALEDELDHDRLDDTVRGVIAEELNAGNYFGREDVSHNVAWLRAQQNIQDLVIHLNGNDASRVPRFYADLLRED